jgi:methionyl-tRNA formyltransferase
MKHLFWDFDTIDAKIAGMTRIVFMGSPAFAVPSLRVVADSVVGIVTQPDRPAGRGKQLTPCPVKQAALELGLPTIQPEKLKEAVEQLQTWSPEVIVVAAFGQILRTNVLNLPPQGCLNVHASLLPRHRGAAPIAAAILAGDAEAGVTLMKMDAGIDTGDMLAKKSIPVEPTDTTTSLTEKLSHLGAKLLKEKLNDYLNGRLTPIKQNDDLATYAPMLKKEDGLLHFSETAVALERRVRAMSDWPGAYTLWKDAPLKIIRCRARVGVTVGAGKVIKIKNEIAVGTSEGVLILDDVQPAGKKTMSAISFVNGNPSFVGAQL